MAKWIVLRARMASQAIRSRAFSWTEKVTCGWPPPRGSTASVTFLLPPSLYAKGFLVDHVGSVLAARDGTIWIGNHAALDFVRGDVRFIHQPKQWLRGGRVTSLFEDHAGRLWVGVDDGLFVYERGRVTPVRRPDGGGSGSFWR